MTPAPEESIRALLRAQAADREREAGRILQEGIDWPAWTKTLNRLHSAEPQTCSIAAEAMRRAANAAGDRPAAARFRFVYGLGMQRTGSMSQAAEELERAVQELQVCGQLAWAARAQVLLLDALAHAGNIDEALARVDETQAAVRSALPEIWQAHLQGNIGNVHRLAGDLDEAVRRYTVAQDAYRAYDRPAEAAIAGMNIGVALLYMGEGDAASREFNEAARTFRTIDQSDRALEAEYNAACADVRRGALAAGIRTLEELAEGHEAGGQARREALCRMDLAGALLRAGDRESAGRQAARAARGFRQAEADAERIEAELYSAATTAGASTNRSELEDVAGRAAALGRPDMELRARLLALQCEDEAEDSAIDAAAQRLAQRAGDLGQREIQAEVALFRAGRTLADGRAEEALRQFGDSELLRPGRLWIESAALTGMARAEAALGRHAEALARLDAVTAQTDAIRGALPGAWLRTAFLLDRLDPYLTRIEVLLARSTDDDRRQAQQHLDALAARRFHEGWSAGSRSPRLSRLRARLEAIYDQLAGGEGPLRGNALPRSVLERDAARLELAVADAWRDQERSRTPSADERTEPTPGVVPADVVTIHYWRSGDRLRLLVARGSDAPRIHDVGSPSAVMQELDELAFHARRAGRLASAGGAAALDAVRAALARRFEAPLRPLLESATQAWIVSDPRAPDVPWELLPSDGALLASRVGVLRVPAVSVRRPATTADGRMAVVALAPPDLPGVADEARRLAGHGAVHAGEQASRAVVSEALADCGVVHLAGHGFDATRAPALGGVRVADGWFTVADLPERIGAQLVVLAACRSGGGGGRAFEAWGGLPRALLRRGARNVLWTAGDVDDQTTAMLAEAFHEARGVGSVPGAFAHALQSVHQRQRHCGNLIQFRLSGIAS